MKLKIFLIIVLSCLFAPSTDGQQSYSVLDKNKPSVYLSYVSETVVDENCSLKKRSAHRLALHNNTSKPINISANYPTNIPTINLRLSSGAVVKGLPEGASVTLCYAVESILEFTSKVENGSIQTEIPVRRALPEVVIYCSCAFDLQKYRRDDYEGVWVAPGRSVIFAIPKEYLVEGFKIYTLFNYEWEFEGGKLRGNEPHHQVYFYASDIPKGK